MNRLLILFLSVYNISALAQEKETIYVGTFSVRGSEGIYVTEFDPADGSLAIIQTVPTLESPSYVEVHPSGKFLYSANRGSVDGVSKTNGSVSAFAIDAVGKLKPVNSLPAFGLGPCHISIDRKATMALVSHFHEGTLAVFSLRPDGSLGTMTDSIRYTGHGLDPQRQNKPHIHSATFTPGDRSILVADLGGDRIFNYQSKTVDGKLIAASPPIIHTKPGTGPRHLAMHPNGKYFFLSEEISCTVAAFGFNAKTGEVTLIEDAIRSLPEDFYGKSSASDIQISPDGKFVYMANRGPDTLEIFEVMKNGRLNLIGHQNVGGKQPRFMMFDETGNYFLCANQDSDNIVIFSVDKKSGMLTPSGKELKIPSPVCLKSLKR